MQQFALKEYLKERHVKTKVYPCLPNHTHSHRNRHKTFTLFPLLPAEIRLKIWDIALHIPIRVDLRVVRDKSWNPAAEFKLVRLSMNPYLTMICAESRQVALQHHRLCFDETSYINFATDCGVCLRSGTVEAFYFFMCRLTPYELSSMENLILKLSVWRGCSDAWFQSQIRKLTGLRMLQFLVDEEDELFAFEVTKDVIREELKKARGEDDLAWKVPRVVIIDPYGLEKDQKRLK